MPDYYYQIKGKNEDNTWLFPPLWSGKVTADNRKQAKSIIEEQYEQEFPMRVLKKDIDSHAFLLVIREIEDNDYYTKKLFEVSKCKKCDTQFKVIEKYQYGNSGGSFEFCSSICAKEYKTVDAYVDYRNGAKSVPVIYKITHKGNGKCYIGKTAQPFTLRWYQHFFQTKGTKFHTAIKESQITDWVFEVIEIIDMPEEIKKGSFTSINDYIFEREMFYINMHDSIRNGYNSVMSKAEQVEDLQAEILFPVEQEGIMSDNNFEGI